MAETTTVSSPLKRQRDEQELEITTKEETKRQMRSSSSSSDNQVLSLVEDKADDNDITSLITTLQQEISTENQNTAVSSPSSYRLEYEEEKEKVMKHLLQASEDELGIPNTAIGGSNYGMTKKETNQDNVNGFRLLDGFGDGLWEIEDEGN